MKDNVFEGGPCPVRNCGGTLELTQDPCFCSTTSHPPCGSCENSKLACDTCDWDEDEDPEDWGDIPEPTANTVTYDKSMKNLF